jgi:hypothetical protein
MGSVPQYCLSRAGGYRSIRPDRDVQILAAYTHSAQTVPFQSVHAIAAYAAVAAGAATHCGIDLESRSRRVSEQQPNSTGSTMASVTAPCPSRAAVAARHIIGNNSQITRANENPAVAAGAATAAQHTSAAAIAAIAALQDGLTDERSTEMTMRTTTSAIAVPVCSVFT